MTVKAPALIEGLQILEIIARYDTPVSFQFLESCSKMSRASVTRLLKVLSDSGYIESGKSLRDGYSLGIKFLLLLKESQDRLKNFNGLNSKLDVLSKKTMSSIQFAIFDRNKPSIEVIDKAEFEDAPTLAGRGCEIAPYSHRHALGKVIMAFATDTEVESILKLNVPNQNTPYTVMPGVELNKILHIIKAGKIAFENQECTLGIQRVALPIFNSRGKIYGGICASWFGTIFSKYDSLKRASQMSETADYIGNLI